jgi:hypothetical protein
MCGHVEMDDPATFMREYEKDEQDPEAECRHGEEIHRHQMSDMVGQKGLPRL